MFGKGGLSWEKAAGKSFAYNEKKVRHFVIYFEIELERQWVVKPGVDL